MSVLFLTVRSHFGEMELLNFLAPAATISGFLISREFLEGGGPFARRFTVLMRLVLPLAAGVLLPILLFLAPFALNGALPAVTRGVIAGTGAHVQFIRSPLPPLSALWPAVPYTIVLGAGSLAPFRFAGPFRVLLAVALAAALWLSGVSEEIYRIIWYSARFLGVSIVFAACLRLREAHRSGFWSFRDPAEDLPAGRGRGDDGPGPVSVRSADLLPLFRAARRARYLRSRSRANPIRPGGCMPGCSRSICSLACFASTPAPSTLSVNGSSVTIRPPFWTSPGPAASGSARRTPPSTARWCRSCGRRAAAGRSMPGLTANRSISCPGLREAVSYGAGSPRDPMERPDDVFRSSRRREPGPWS